ncbi:MAG: lyase family protein, partial [Candidatus Margulisbacteria bacterium]|nr:lyase family protein [Candidatus Margulisiibacteriota bacterium]
MQSKPKKLAKPWAGRFREPLAKLAEQFTASVHYDIKLYKQDIIQSIAYARSLQKAQIINPAECKKIIKALEDILRGIQSGHIKLKTELEDVH